MNKLSLQYLNNITFSQPNNTKNSNGFAITLSPSTTLLTAMDQNSNIHLVNILANEQQSINLNKSIIKVLFTVDDKFLIFNDKSSIHKYSTVNAEVIAIVPSNSEYNSINNLMLTPDYTTIIFTNHTEISAYHISHQKTFHFILNNNTNCAAYKIKIQPTNNILVSSSYDCNICTYQLINSTNLQFKHSTSIPHCRVNKLSFYGQNIVLIQDSISGNKPEMIILNLQTLKVVSNTTQQSSNMSLALLNVQNYIISYAVGDSFLWIYQNSLKQSPQYVSLAPWAIIDSQYNYKQQEIYLSLFDQLNQIATIHTYRLSYNCSTVKNSSTNSSMFQNTCPCRQKLVFDRQTMACTTLNCIATSGTCECPYGLSFNSFRLQCELNCSLVYSSLPSPTFNFPQKCYCSVPFAWNSMLSDCSLIDCSFINGSSSDTIGKSCSCQSQLTWVESNLTCMPTSQSLDAATSKQLSIGLILGFLFLSLIIIILGVIYYHKKYKKEPEEKRQVYRPRSINEVSPTQRPIHQYKKQPARSNEILSS